MRETAYAKINLALHVRRRREDGYHELETLFAFVDAGDRLSAVPTVRDELRVVGEFAGALDDPFGNIVAKALAALPWPGLENRAGEEPPRRRRSRRRFGRRGGDLPHGRARIWSAG